MKSSRSNSLPKSNDDRSPRQEPSPKTNRRRIVNSTPNPSRSRPQGSASTISASDYRPYTTLPRIPKDPRLSTVSGTSLSSVATGTKNELPHSERVLSAAAVLWRKKQLHDVILSVGHHRIGAHRLILAVCSGYFNELFTNEEAEDRDEANFVYTLHGISYEALKTLLESMYTSHLNVTYENICELLNAAIYLKVPVALNTCKEFLLLNLCADTSLTTLSVAFDFDLNEIIEQATQIAAMNFVHISKTNEFLAMEVEPLKHLLLRDDLRVDSELQVFKAVQSWVEADMDVRLNDSVVDVLCLVRLPMIAPTDLVDHVENIDYFMQIPHYDDLVKEALHYYCLPMRQSILQSPRTNPRSLIRLKTVVSLGGQPRKAKEGVSKEIRYFNPDTNSWNLLAKMPQPRHHHAVAVLGGFLYVAGGREKANPTDHPLKTAYRYDPRTNSWIQIADLLHSRESFQLGVLNHMLYAIGGRVDDKTSLAEVERYDPFKDKWVAVAPLTDPRRCVAVTTHDKLLYAMGGSGQGKISSRVECYDAVSNTWKTRKPLQIPRIFALLSPLGDHIYLAGGATVDNSGGLCCVANIEKYHPFTDTWTTLSCMLTPRAEAACTVIDKRIFYLGGYNWDTKSWVQTVEAYDASDDSWEEIGNFPKAYTGMACCTLTLHKLP
ncbi:Kelch-like protein 9 [Holothuria leucospilota]|uniref:Kelch-like protein 9 n=1 Tax=Holothuria leucospilota TaxID=206669 RepID=A0A9Q1H0P7_HOLLE|nr:Kelch-like protein 9 [Holothuria leucospilota]